MPRRRNPDDFRTSKPSLSAVLAEQKGDHIIVTIQEVKEQKFGDSAKGERERNALVIVTTEYPENGWFPNSGKGGSVERLFDRLGDDLDRWAGQRVPLVRVRDVYNPQTGDRNDVFHAARLEEWDDMLRAGKRATPAAVAAKAPAKKGRVRK